jgi:hypothetical protein
MPSTVSIELAAAEASLQPGARRLLLPEIQLETLDDAMLAVFSDDGGATRLIACACRERAEQEFSRLTGEDLIAQLEDARRNNEPQRYLVWD